MGLFKKIFGGKHKHDFAWDGQKLQCKGCEEIREAEYYTSKMTLLMNLQNLTGTDKSVEMFPLLAEYHDKTKLVDSCVALIKKRGGYIKQNGMLQFISGMELSANYFAVLMFMKKNYIPQA